MTKKLPFWSKLPRKHFSLAFGIILSVAVVFIASALYFSRKEGIRLELKFPFTKDRQSSSSSSGKQTITIDARNIRVPEPNEKTFDNGLAVPKTAMTAAPGAKSKIRSFGITIKNNALSANKIIVYKNDIVNIKFTASDKAYTLVFPDFGIKGEASAGETKTVEFQAVKSGSFIFSCETCKKPKSRFEQNLAQGVLLVIPRT